MSSLELRIADDHRWAAEEPPRVATRGAALALGLVGPGLWAVDVAIVLAAFMLAYWARFVVPDAESYALGLEHYALMGGTVGLLTTGLLALQGFYDRSRVAAWTTRIYAALSAVSIALAACLSATALLGDYRFSRLWFALGWAFAVVSLVLWRTAAPALVSRWRAALGATPRALVVGANPLGEQLGRELAERYQVVGYVDNGSDLPLGSGPPLLGTIAELDAIVHAYGVDLLVIALPASRREQVATLLTRGFRRGVEVRFLPDLGEVLPNRLEVARLAGRPAIGFLPVARVSWVKRASDLVLGTLLLLGLTPLLVAIALIIKLDSPGPVFYRQERVGKDGRRFLMFKFRSMRPDADQLLAALRERNEATGPLFKMRDDPRVTRVGRVLRRLSLDELPQLFNVLRGEMSLVGPRPPLPKEVAEYEDWQYGRLRAIPGMTGLWQVSGRSEVPFVDMVRLDLHYIRNWSLALDLEILLRTLPAVLSNRGAY